jgi:hypothetical protein
MHKNSKNKDQTFAWESEFIEGITGCIKFPVTIHEISDLESVVEIKEKVDYTPPRKKLNEVRVVEVGKTKVKKSKGNLF